MFTCSERHKGGRGKRRGREEGQDRTVSCTGTVDTAQVVLLHHLSNDYAHYSDIY